MKQPTSGTRRTIAATLLLSPLLAGSSRGRANTSTAQERPPSDGGSVEDPSQVRAIVQRADDVRFPRGSFSVEVQVTSTVQGQQQEPRRYRILSRDSEDTIVQTLEPATDRGQHLLMKGRELWMFLPSVSQPVRLSLSQRLTGQVANGDLARTRFADDYEPRLVGTERLQGKDHHVLELTAVERAMTYPRIRYWVRAADQHPHRAEFHAQSGKLMKTCLFDNYQPLGGRMRPTRLVMTDALKEGDQSVLDYSALTPRELPARMFTKEYLRKLD